MLKLPYLFLPLLLFASVQAEMEPWQGRKRPGDNHSVRGHPTIDAQRGQYYVVFRKESGEKTIVSVELATTQKEHAKGLMFRKELAKDHGMLFIFKVEQQRSFWMKNTFIPLDIIFLSKDLRIISIALNAQPCKQDPCPLYFSKKPAQYVVEVNAGFVAENGLAQGDIASIKKAFRSR